MRIDVAAVRRASGGKSTDSSGGDGDCLSLLSRSSLLRGLESGRRVGAVRGVTVGVHVGHGDAGVFCASVVGPVPFPEIPSLENAVTGDVPIAYPSLSSVRFVKSRPHTQPSLRSAVYEWFDNPRSCDISNSCD
jgi:hypothetical protein